MKLYIKVIISIAIVVLVVAGLLLTPQGKKAVGQLLLKSGGFSALIEKEKLNNINKKIDLTLPVTVQGYDTKIGNFITTDTLILSVNKNCPACEQIMKKMASLNDVPFIVLGFNNAVIPEIGLVENKLMILATTSLQPEKFYMDSIISPVVFHVSSLGVIKKKHIKLDDKKITEITSEIKE